MAFTVTVTQAQTAGWTLSCSYPPNATPLCGGAWVHPQAASRSCGRNYLAGSGRVARGNFTLGLPQIPA